MALAVAADGHPQVDAAGTAGFYNDLLERQWPTNMIRTMHARFVNPMGVGPTFAAALLWMAQVQLASGQSLLDPNLNVGQITGLTPAPLPQNVPSTPAGTIAPLDPMSAEERQWESEFHKVLNEKDFDTQSVKRIIAILEKGLEACRRGHREEPLRAEYWYYQLLCFHQRHGDIEKALENGLLAVAKLKQRAAASGLPEGAHVAGGGGLLQGRVVRMLGVLGRWDEATAHVKECRPYFEDPSEERTAVLHVRTNPTPALGYHQGLMGLGKYQEWKGEYSDAARWYDRAAKFALANFGKTHQYGEALTALADAYHLIRDYQRAEPLRLEALDVLKNLQGERGYDCINAQVALAWNYNKQGRHAEAERIMRHALELAPKQSYPTGQGGDAWLAAMKSSLADIVQRTGKYSEATQLFAEAMEVAKRTDLPHFSGQNRELDIACRHFNSGNSLFYYARQFREAEDHLLKALNYFEAQTTIEMLDYTDRARRALAAAQWHQGKKAAARETARKWMQGYSTRLSFILRFTSEDQRLSWMAWQSPFDLAATFGMAEDTALALLRSKGIVLDTVMEDRVLSQKAASNGLGSDWDTLRKTRDDLRQAWAAPQPDLALITKLESEETELQSRMATAGAGTASVRTSLATSVQDVQKNLQPGSVLIDYFRFRDSAPAGHSIERYAAIVYHRDAAPELKIMPWTALQLDDALHVFRNAMRKLPTAPRAKDADLEILMKTLHSGFITPLESSLKSAKTIFISADSELNFLPFATLINEQGKFLCERFEIRQVSSARDLASRQDASEDGPGTVAVYGNASYRLDQTLPVEPSGEGVRAFTEQMHREKRTILAPLPGTKRELEAISKRARDAGWTIHEVEGTQATESSVRSVRGPRILHLATHGYFMERHIPLSTENAVNLTEVNGRPQRLRSMFDPMSRSGVFLAGAENSFEEWNKGSTFKLDNDGVLTASEAGNLDLNGTWLVVLSACDTGAGDSVSGEGVLGLRRAFSYAGARNVMMSLWPIYDEQAADFVDEFYANAFASSDAAAALHETQRAWLVRLKIEQGLWHAIKCGGAFILVGTGR